MDTENRPTQDYPSRDKDPMQQLQVIRIPREFREKLAQARLAREGGQPDDTTDGNGPLVGLAVVAVLYLAGMLIAYTTGFGNAVLISVTPAARTLITVLAIAGSVISVFWLVYAIVRSSQHDEYDEYA